MRVRSAFYTIAALLATYTLAVSVRAYRRVPYLEDIYNLVYDNSRLKKPESTDAFLLLMPALTILGIVATIIHVERSLERDRRGEESFSAGKAMLAFLGICVLCLIGLERVRVVCQLFRC